MDADVSRSFLNNFRDRLFDAQHYPAGNPYESPVGYPYQTGYEFPNEPEPQSYGTGRYGYGQQTFHHHVYSPHVGGRGGSGHKSKNSGLAISALTLLAFLFFINMLQSCLKEQMSTMNPTVMVMTAGRYRKDGVIQTDSNKELNSVVENDASPVSDNIDALTNDQGDVFFRPAQKVSVRLDHFEGRNLDNPSHEKVT